MRTAATARGLTDGSGPAPALQAACAFPVSDPVPG